MKLNLPLVQYMREKLVGLQSFAVHRRLLRCTDHPPGAAGDDIILQEGDVEAESAALSRVSYCSSRNANGVE